MTAQRRSLILGAAIAVALPKAAFAQSRAKPWRIGFLALRQIRFDSLDFYYLPLRDGLRDLGYVEGKNLIIEWRSAEGDIARLPGLARELVDLKVALIVVAGSQATAAAQAATTTIPIVMGSTGDPIG